ncbi:GNAT family N-acetyltransferase [Flavobacterium sp. JP2137]|uniref:GNAT family N-acetyltransferase n=1 Tax=Flavobacterium sp. JP2137 TaxID=3414510 RepID=UPI003D2FCDB9
MTKLIAAPLIELKLPNRLELLPSVMVFIRDLIEKHPFTAAQCQHIEMAVEEALANVIQHAFTVAENAHFTVQYTVKAYGIELAIVDQGTPYEHRIPEAMYNDSYSGLGQYVIGKLLDKVAFENLGKGGKKMTLTHYFTQPLTELPPQPLAVASDTELASEVVYSFRAFKPDDAVDISRCAYESYGYTYAYEHLYFPERIRLLNESGELISFVAVTQSGEVVGHVGLVPFDADTSICEVGLAMTKQQHRGGAVFSRLMDKAFTAAQNAGFTALFGQCITAHTYSQSYPLRLGMLPTALMPAYAPDDISFKKIQESKQTRTGVLIVTSVFNSTARANYVPQRYVAFLSDRYRDLGTARTLIFQQSSAEGLSAATAYSFSIYPHLKMAKVSFSHCGAELQTHIEGLLQRARKERLEVLELFVDLTQKSAPLLIDTAEQGGFKLVGILPGGVKSDFAILVYLNGIDAHLEQISVLPQGQPILHFIQQQFNSCKTHQL